MLLLLYKYDLPNCVTNFKYNVFAYYNILLFVDNDIHLSKTTKIVYYSCNDIFNR